MTATAVHVINNEGVGGSGQLTMYNCTDSDQDFTQTDLDNNLIACGITDGPVRNFV